MSNQPIPLPRPSQGIHKPTPGSFALKTLSDFICLWLASGEGRGRGWQRPGLHAPSGGPHRQGRESWPNPKDFQSWRPQSIQSRRGLQCSSGLYPRLSFRRRGMLGGGPEPLALILARVGCPHVLPSLHLLQTVLVHFPLGEDEEEDTTGEADGPRGGEMCTGFGEGPSLSQRSWGNLIPASLVARTPQYLSCLCSLRTGCWRAPSKSDPATALLKTLTALRHFLAKSKLLGTAQKAQCGWSSAHLFIPVPYSLTLLD